MPVFVCCCSRFFLLLVASYTDISLASVLALIGMCVCVCMVAFNIELAVSCHCTLPINVLYTLSTAFTHSTRTIYRRRQQQKTNTHNTTSNSNSSKYQEVKEKTELKRIFFLSSAARSRTSFMHFTTVLHLCSFPHVCNVFAAFATISFSAVSYRKKPTLKRRQTAKEHARIKQFCNL